MSQFAIQGTCLCKAVQVGVARLPEQVTQCNCSVCRSYGTLWSYFPRSAVTITAAPGALAEYSRRARGLRFVRCAGCGCVICWDGRSGGPDQRMGVNMRLLDHAAMANVPIKVLDGDGAWRTLEIYAKPGIWISPTRKAAKGAKAAKAAKAAKPAKPARSTKRTTSAKPLATRRAAR